MSLMTQGGAVSVIVAVVLLMMSIASWVVILWKAWLLKRAVGDVARSAAAFWQSASVAEGAEKVALFDREALLLPLIAASNMAAGNTLATRGDKSQQLTQVTRKAFQVSLDAMDITPKNVVRQHGWNRHGQPCRRHDECLTDRARHLVDGDLAA